MTFLGARLWLHVVDGVSACPICGRCRRGLTRAGAHGPCRRIGVAVQGVIRRALERRADVIARAGGAAEASVFVRYRGSCRAGGVARNAGDVSRSDEVRSVESRRILAVGVVIELKRELKLLNIGNTARIATLLAGAVEGCQDDR